MKLIVGLGNPGRKFNHSRHNVGFACIDYMSRKWGIKLAQRRAKAVLGQGVVADESVVLARPRTFMNRSGEGITYLLTRFAATAGDLIVVYDEMDLPAGGVRIRPQGGAAGHNGIKSIIEALSTQEFTRVRVGIGTPSPDIDGMDYVLGHFSLQERLLVNRAVATVAEAIESLLRDGIGAAMNRFN